MPRDRRSVDLSGHPDLVVIYLGYRVTALTGLRSLLRIGRGLRDIRRDPPPGLLAHENMLFGLMHFGFRQYWRDFESLEAFTRAPQHADWWRNFTRDFGGGGIWHEAYRMRGGMEAIYSGMPRIGFGSFAPERIPTGPFASARQRITAAPEPASA